MYTFEICFLSSGSVIRQFKAPKDDNFRASMTGGDTEFLQYDSSTESLVVNGDLKTRTVSQILYLM